MERKMRLLAVALASLLLQFCPAWADPSAQDYGVADIIVTDQEKMDAQRYGGYPNNKDFNNDTRCRVVTSLFAVPGIGPQHPKMRAFLTFSRVSFMMLDMTFGAMTTAGTAIEAVGSTEWKALPALLPAYCRQHPTAKMEDALQAAYTAARITHGLEVP